MNRVICKLGLPGKGVLGPGGAMDLVVGVKEVIVATSHVAKNGKHKLIPVCTVPLTGIKVVNNFSNRICGV